MIELFDYQKKLIDDFDRALEKGFRRPLLVCPTGSGKTIVAGYISKKWLDNAKTVLFVAHRDELITQARDKFKEFGIYSGLIKAGRDKDARPQARCQIASIQTYSAGGNSIRSPRMARAYKV